MRLTDYNDYGTVARAVSEARSSAENQVLEATLPLLYQRSGAIDADDPLYSELTRSHTDLPQYDHDRQMAVALYLSTANPFAKRYIDILEAFTMGDGPVPMAPDKSVSSLVRDFWYNDYNEMDMYSLQFARELAIYGEQLVSIHNFDDGNTADAPDIFVDGLMAVQRIDPLRIYKVKPLKYDDYKLDSVILRKDNYAGMVEDEDDPKLRLRLARETLINGKRRLVDGHTLFFKLNSVGTSTRGIGDLYTLADFLHLFRWYQFNMAKKLNHLSTFIFDVVVQGANRQKLAEVEADLMKRQLKSGSVFVHNEGTTLEPKFVNMGDTGSGMIDVNNSLFGTIVTGSGLPAHWAAGLSSTGRSVAEAAHDPAMKWLVTRQAKIRHYLSKMIRMQIDFAMVSNNLAAGSNEQFKLVFPKLALRDFQRSAGAAARIVMVIRDLVDAGLMPREVADRFIPLAFEQAGMIDTVGKLEGDDGSSGSSAPTSSDGDMNTSESIHISKHLRVLEDVVDETLGSGQWPTEKAKEIVKNEIKDLIIYHLVE